MKRQANKLIYAVTVTALILIIAITIGGGALFERGAAFAVTLPRSDVMSDLKKDKAFTTLKYPSNPFDNSLDLIQIAESENGELFLYVYQPSADVRKLTATTARISQTTRGELSENLDIHDYKLTLVSRSGVFGKYLVNGLCVSSETERIYEITALHRKFDKTIDGGTGNDNTINEVVFDVSQRWKATTVADGTVSYSMQAAKSILITTKYVGRLRYWNGFKYNQNSCDSWYVAFSTDITMDELYEAELTYVSRPYDVRLKPSVTQGYEEDYRTYGAYNAPVKVELSSIDPAAQNNAGIFGRKHTWDRIETVEAFTAKEDLTTEAAEQIEGKTWVLRFAETDVNVKADYQYYYEMTEISSVTILRLKYVTDGITYNLGVVDNKQTGTTISNNPEVEPFSMPVWGWFAVAGVALLLLIVLGVMFPPVGRVLLAIGKVLIFPFTAIARAVQSSRARRASTAATKTRSSGNGKRRSSPSLKAKRSNTIGGNQNRKKGAKRK